MPLQRWEKERLRYEDLPLWRIYQSKKKIKPNKAIMEVI